MKTVAKYALRLTLVFVAWTAAASAVETEWWDVNDIKEGYGFATMEVLSNGDVFAVLYKLNSFPDQYSFECKKSGTTKFETFWTQAPADSIQGQVRLTSYDSTLFYQSGYSRIRFNADGSTTNLVCADSAWPNQIVPIDENSVFIFGAFGLEKPIGNTNALFKVVRNVIDSGCVEEYVADPAWGQGFLTWVATDQHDTPYFTFDARRPTLGSIDTLIRTRGGAGVAIEGFKDARYYDADFISKEDFGWVVVLETRGASGKPGLLLKLNNDFSLHSSFPLPGLDDHVVNVRSQDGKILVCQWQTISVFDLATETWIVKTFEDVVGRKPLTDGESVLKACLHQQDLYVCSDSGIRVFRDIITSVHEQPSQVKQQTQVVYGNQTSTVQTLLPDGRHDVTTYSILGEQRTFTADVQNGMLLLNSDYLWNGLNVVQSGRDQLRILYVP